MGATFAHDRLRLDQVRGSARACLRDTYTESYITEYAQFTKSKGELGQAGHPGRHAARLAKNNTQPHPTEHINQIVVESQLTNKIVNLLFS